MQVRLSDYAWSAGVATELVNSAPEARTSRVDELPDVETLHAFLARHQLGSAAVSARDLAETHALRPRLSALLTEPDVAAATALTGPLEALTLDEDGTGWAAVVPDGAPTAQVLASVSALGVLGTLLHLGPDRFRRCEAGCPGGLFIDTSRAGRRRYCEPSRCGNRLNSERHRSRRRAE